MDSRTAEEDIQTNEWSELPTKAEATKENRTSAVDGAIRQRVVAPRTPKVTIFRDDVSAKFERQPNDHPSNITLTSQSPPLLLLQ